MEPRLDRYLPFLKPLLELPSSRYQLRDLDSSLQWRPRSYFAEGLLSDFQSSGNASHKSAGRNDSLLIIANMSSTTESQKPKHGAGHESHKVIMDFANDLRAGTGFHAHGPVRMLVWVTEMEKQALIPRTVHHRRKLSLLLETTCHIEEIVTGSRSVRGKTQFREDFLDVESGKKVAERMRRRGVEIPQERQDEMQKKVQDVLQGVTSDDTATVSIPGGTSPDISREWHKELRQLKEDFGSGKLSQFIGGQPGIERTKKVRNDGSIHSPEWKRMVEMERTLKTQQRRKNDVDNLVTEQEKLDCLELDAYQEGLSEVDRQEKLEELDQRTREFRAQLSAVAPTRSNQHNFLIDDRRAFAQHPPLLMWDQRSAEPLLAREDEFHKPKDMTLLDFQPRCPQPYPMTTTQAAYFDVITTALIGNGSQTPSSLKQLAPGAMEALVSRVPALKDPRKGGHRDLEDLRSRVMTPEMVYGLTLAWDKWVFKPTLADIWARSNKWAGRT